MHNLNEIKSQAPSFVNKLWRLVEDPKTNNLIHWSKDGRSFIIENPAQFARELLPLNYKHNNMASFIRQLNMYGFRKITSIDSGNLRFDREDMKFCHPFFKRNSRNLLNQIKRKIHSRNPPTEKTTDEKTTTNPNGMRKVLIDVMAMRVRQDSLFSKFIEVKQENEALWSEIESLRQKHAQIIRFLMTTVQPGKNTVSTVNHLQSMLCESPKYTKLRNVSESGSERGSVIHELAEEFSDETTAENDLDLDEPSSPYPNILSVSSSRAENESPIPNVDRPQSSASIISLSFDDSNQSAEDFQSNPDNVTPGRSGSLISTVNPDGSQFVYHVTEVIDSAPQTPEPITIEENHITTPMVQEMSHNHAQQTKPKTIIRKNAGSISATITTADSISSSPAAKMLRSSVTGATQVVIKTEIDEIEPLMLLNGNYKLLNGKAKTTTRANHSYVTNNCIDMNNDIASNTNNVVDLTESEPNEVFEEMNSMVKEMSHNHEQQTKPKTSSASATITTADSISSSPASKMLGSCVIGATQVVIKTEKDEIDPLMFWNDYQIPNGKATTTTTPNHSNVTNNWIDMNNDIASNIDNAVYLIKSEPNELFELFNDSDILGPCRLGLSPENSQKRKDAISSLLRAFSKDLTPAKNHPYPQLRKDIIENLKLLDHNTDETVRYEVVMVIFEIVKTDFEIVCDSEELLEFVKERTLDKEYKMRREAMNILAMIYKKILCAPNDFTEARRKTVSWIKNKILHCFNVPNIEDRLLVERLLITCLVPYKMSADNRMKKLYHIFGTLDENATKAFIELQKSQWKIRKIVSDWVKLHHTKEITTKLQKELNMKLTAIRKLLPEPLNDWEYLTKFSVNMHKDPELLSCMEVILKPDVSCKECVDTISTLLEKLDKPIVTSLYYNTVKMLLERIASVMVDRESIFILISLIENCIQEGEYVDEVGISRKEAGERGLKLLSVLSSLFSAHFLSKPIMRHMIDLMNYDVEYAAPLVLEAFTHLGRYKPLCEVDNEVLDEMVPICRDFALSGTVKEAKHAVRCIFTNTQTIGPDKEDAPVIHPMFSHIIDILKTCFGPYSEDYRTKVVCLGHIAYNMPAAFETQIKNMISKHLVKDLLAKNCPYDLSMKEWCEESELPPETLCKLDALKTMARWLLGLKTDKHSAQKTFRLLSVFILEKSCAAEQSWLRLTAACSMLKICEHKGFRDQYSAEQYFSLSQLMCDPVREVREIFTRKLHKGLKKGLPNKCLPLDFMGFYVLCGHEKDEKLLESMKHYVESDVSRRRDYLKTIGSTNGPTRLILPDYMLAFAIPILAHDSQFTNYEDSTQLKEVEKCLRFILQPLMADKETFPYGFYKNLVEQIKNHEDATPNAENNSYNFKMWAACDLAMQIINSEVGVCHSRDFSSTIKLPAIYYQPSIGLQNKKICIPVEDNSLTTKTGTFVSKSNDRKNSSSPAVNKRCLTLPPNNNKSIAIVDLTIDSPESNGLLVDNIESEDLEEEQQSPKRMRTRSGQS